MCNYMHKYFSFKNIFRLMLKCIRKYNISVDFTPLAGFT